MGKLDFIYARHSVRRYTEQDVSWEDIKEILTAAIHAPVGRAKNWHFVVIKNKEKINGVARIIRAKNEAVAAGLKSEELKKPFINHLAYETHFVNAPVLILAYGGPYPVTGLDELREAGVEEREIDALERTVPAVQNVAAAMENLMLAAAQLGYGTCWMTGPNYAAAQITEYLGIDLPGYNLMLMTPLGIPAGPVKSPSRKPVEEYTTVIE